MLPICTFFHLQISIFIMLPVCTFSHLQICKFSLLSQKLCLIGQSNGNISTATLQYALATQA
jgi:hypothetical protein